MPEPTVIAVNGVELGCEEFGSAAHPAPARSHLPAITGWSGATVAANRESVSPRSSRQPLVIHGTHDPLFPIGHGEALAREIPGARLLPIEGMGHQVPPPPTWAVIVPAVLEHTAR